MPLALGLDFDHHLFELDFLIVPKDAEDSTFPVARTSSI